MKSSFPLTFRWVDLVRTVGAFLVVMAHVAFQGGGSELAASYYFIVSRVAVPLFFMASGYLLLGKEEPYGVFFRKRALKVIVPFVAWSVIYMLWKKEGFEAGFSFELVISYILKIIRGPRENHLWFFYVLIGLYLFAPILRVFVARAAMQDLWYFCGLWFLVTPVFSFLQEFTPLKIGFELYLVAGYTGYFVLGHLLGKLQFTRRQLYLLIFLFFVFSIGSALLNALVKSDYFSGYLSMNIVLMTAFAFVLLREIPISDSFNRFLAPLSRASFGIYLAHVIVLAVLEQWPVTAGWFFAGSSVYMIPLLGLLGFFVSFVVVAVFQKIPILRWIVP